MIDYAVAMLKNPAHPEEPQKAYAFLQSRATLTIEEIADHMVSHGCNYDRGDIIAILIKLVSCSKELMLDGYRIELGDLGKLFLSCQSEGAPSKEKFTRVNYLPGKSFENLRRDAEFEKTTTRKAQAAALKAENEGLTNANWSDEEEDGD